MTGTGPIDAPEPVGWRVRRAGAFAVVGSLALLTPGLAGRVSEPVATVAAIVPFLLVSAVALYGTDGGPLFDLFARPGDRRAGRLYSLAGFALALAGLALLATEFGLPPAVFAATALLVAYGDLAQQVVAALARSLDRDPDPVVPVAGFAIGGAVAALGGVAASAALGGEGFGLRTAVFLASTGALAAALLRSVLFERDDPLVLLSVGLLLWLFADLPVSAAPQRLAVGLALAVLFGVVAYAIDAASITGMLAGVLLALLAVVLGGYGWFAVLVSFFALGGLASKFRYEQKRERGVAQSDEGARSSANVLANSAAALASILGFAASARLGVDPVVFLFAFTGSVAAAMSDTLSSEIGGLFDGTRLITTLERVEPGTDGGVTWQGTIGGLLGAVVIAAVGFPFFAFGPVELAIVVAAGVAGMIVDSLLGATVEDDLLDNQGVNLAATAAAAVVAAGLAVAFVV